MKALTPTTVDISNGQAFVVMELTLQDEASGLLGGNLKYGDSPLEGYSFGFGGIWLDNGEFIEPPNSTVSARHKDVVTVVVNMRIRQYQPPGVFNLQLFTVDRMHNFNAQYDDSGVSLAADGYPSTLTIINSVVDTTPPQLINFTALTPLFLNGSDEKASVVFEIVVQDDLAGIDYLELSENGEENAVFGTVSKTVNDTSWLAFNHDPELPGGGVPHTLRLTLSWSNFNQTVGVAPRAVNLGLAVLDGVFNFAYIDSETLASRGFPATVMVI